MMKRSVSPIHFLPLLTLLACVPASAQFSLDREPPGPSSRKTGLVITEIMYNPRPVPGLATNLTLEFIELFNSKPWAENIGGFAIGGTVSYLFPSNTMLGAGAYLVVARVPQLIQTNYNITNVFGPWVGAETNGLSIEEGTVQLLNRQGAVLLTVNYEDSPPWPEAADGTGHSLSLARPSYGEDDFRAWSESDRVGGSPGGPDPKTMDPLANVVINEWQNHSDPVDWIELYNHGNTAVDLSGAWLSDDPTTNKFRIPDGTTLPGRGFRSWDQTQLGFELFAGGETIFFWNSNQTRVIDVIDFRGQSNNITSGRWPDGGPIQYGLATRTQGGANSGPMRYGVVITELMYNPISGDVNDEYVEIHNRNNTPVSLAGWEFVVGINYVFPTNSITSNMPPGAYWVIARNPTNLLNVYTNLSTNNTFGPYGGTLANGGERIVLAAADYDIVQNPGGSTVEKLPVPVCDIIYGDGGKWGYWSDGQGSSLELIDVESDPHHPSNWADSSDTGESLWTSIEWTGPLGESLGSPVNDSLIINLQGLGECLVDEVEVRVDNGPNLVANGGFESGLAGWDLQGSHDFSTIEDEGFTGAKSLHVRAGSRGDNQANRILSAPFASPIPQTAGIVSLRAKVRWLRGHPELLLRLHGSATEAYGRMALPRRLGSPGMVNSRRVSNAGPAVYEVKHSPLLPIPSQPVVVTARATDPQGVALIKVRYRVDPTPTYTDVFMSDTGTSGDAIANDGIYTAVIPGQSSGAMVAFYVEARDNQNGIGTFPQYVFPPPGLTRCWPNDAVARECVVRWGETQMPGDFATYHLWVTSANSNRWHTRDAENNASIDGTFVYNNTRVMYNAEPLFSGSPWHRTNSTAGPAGPYRVDYEMNFPDDDPLLGSTDFVLNNPGNPDRLTVSDLSAVAEQTVYRIFEGLNLVHNHRRYIHFFVNGSQRSTAYERPGNFIFEDSQQPNGDMTGQWFPNDAGGQLFKVEDWFEFHDNGFDPTAFNDADLERRTIMLEGEPTFVPASYRYMFRKRSVNVGLSANDYSAIYGLIDAVSPAENPTSELIDPIRLGASVDWEAWMRHFAVQRAVGNWDSFGWERGKNDYLYQTTNGFVHMPWDIDYSLGLGRPANEPLFASNDPRVTAMFNTPAIQRAYWRAFSELVNGPFNNATLDPFIDARTAALAANNVNFDPAAVAAIKTYIADRRAYLQSQLAFVTTPFNVHGSLAFTTNNNLIIIVGTAPVEVKEITVNGAVYPITWTNVTNFVIRVVLNPGANNYVIQGLDLQGNPLASASNLLNVTYTGPVVDPVGSLIINEIGYAAPAPGTQFIEILNRAQFNFDLSGWRLDGANLVFPPGSIVTNGQILVVARNYDAFRVAFPGVPQFAQFNANLTSGQRLVLVRPDPDTAIDGVRYEAAAPWPVATNGVSLQLIDVSQENSRPSNWASDPGAPSTPGAPNSVAGTLTPYEPLWLNELQIESLVGPTDNAGEPAPWLELYNSGATPLSLASYYLADNYTSNLTLWQFPPGATIQPGEHKVIWADGEAGQTAGTNIHTGFPLDYQGRLALVRIVSGQPQIVDYLTWRLPNPNVAYGSFPDGQSVFRLTQHVPTPRTANTRRPLAVMINEWMASNTSGLIRDPADMQTEDWFELYNGETFTVDLSGFYLTLDTNNPTLYQIPTNGQYRIAPGGFLLVWADEQPGQNSAARPHLHADFKLAASGGSIALFAPDGLTLIDSVTYGQQASDVSQGRFTDGAGTIYTLGKATTNGVNQLAGYNARPVFPTIPLLFVVPNSTNTFNIRAIDPEVPQQQLTYSIVSAPAVSLLSQGGLYRWIVPANQPPGDYLVQLNVVDNGTPPRTDTTTFVVRVQQPLAPVVGTPPPIIHSFAGPGGQFTFSFDSVPGRAYRVLYKDDLMAPSWTQLDRDFVAANPIASITDTLSQPQRFYIVLQVD
jgi:hypothetical protein